MFKGRVVSSVILGERADAGKGGCKQHDES